MTVSLRKGPPTPTPYPLASRGTDSAPRVVDVDGVQFGGKEFVVIAGPCAVENEKQLMAAAEAVCRAGARVLRGGAFKPRTSPYSFQGLGKAGLELLAKARRATGLKIVTEVTSSETLGPVCEVADILQIGSRNMSNFALLKDVGRSGKPVLLKRGMAAKVSEFLMAAEYILAEGNPNVILCERGVVTFDTVTRNLFDIGAVPVIKALSHLPIIVDPSHAAGHREYITALSRAGLAVGADGLILEVHPHPDDALCDGPQSITTQHFADLMAELAPLALAMGRSLHA